MKHMRTFKVSVIVQNLFSNMDELLIYSHIIVPVLI